MNSYTFKEITLESKNIFFSSISKVFGIGQVRAVNLMRAIGLQSNIRVNQLNSYHFFVFSHLVNKNYCNDLYLRRLRENNIRLLLSVKSYKSMKYSLGLPIRGQSTRANAKTSKRRVYSNVMKKKLNATKKSKKK